MWLHLCEVQEKQKGVLEIEARTAVSSEVGKGAGSRDWQVRDMGELSRVGGMFYILTAMWFPCMYASVKTHRNRALKICEFSENCNSLKTNFLKNKTFPFSDFLLVSCTPSNCSLDFGGPSSCSHTLLLCASKGSALIPHPSPSHPLMHTFTTSTPAGKTQSSQLHRFKAHFPARLENIPSAA